VTETGDERDQRAQDDLIAAQWLLRLQETNLRDQARIRAEFVQWRDSDVRHANAVARVEAVWEISGAHADTPALGHLRRDTRDEMERLRRRRSARRLGWLGAGATSIASLAASVVWLLFWPAGIHNFSTPIGERRMVRLEDSSRIEIDADSALSVEFSRHQRLVRLVRGQAYFQVAHDSNRPFIVESGGRNIIATGTAFDVETLWDGTTILLVEGHVRVETASQTTPMVGLDPGDLLTAETAQPLHLMHKTNLDAILAWRSGRLVFDGITLPQALLRMGRYARRPIVIDPSLNSLRISGVFSAGDLSGLVEALQRIYPVDARSDADGTLHLNRRPL
jgi:transmembrane sensor